MQYTSIYVDNLVSSYYWILAFYIWQVNNGSLFLSQAKRKKEKKGYEGNCSVLTWNWYCFLKIANLSFIIATLFLDIVTLYLKIWFYHSLQFTNHIFIFLSHSFNFITHNVSWNCNFILCSCIFVSQYCYIIFHNMTSLPAGWLFVFDWLSLFISNKMT